jgi:hypothetical protein
MPVMQKKMNPSHWIDSTVLLLADIGANAANKAGLNALTSSLAAEVVDYKITVNAVLPTIIDSPANRVAMPKSDPSRWVLRLLPEQLADIAHTLVSRWGVSALALASSTGKEGRDGNKEAHRELIMSSMIQPHHPSGGKRDSHQGGGSHLSLFAQLAGQPSGRYISSLTQMSQHDHRSRLLRH